MDGFQAIETIARPRLADAVAEQLSQMIASRSLRSGDALPSEGALAQRFGVSKPVVREALRSLSVLGVIEIQQGRLATVRTPTATPLESMLRFSMSGSDRGLQEAIELRRTLETELAALAASRITDEELVALDSIVREMRQHVETVNPWIEDDMAFHLLIARSSRNHLMLHLMEALSGLLKETIALMHVQRKYRDSQATLARHVTIYAALAAHDSETARQAMKTHFDASEAVLQEVLQHQALNLSQG